MQKLDFTGRTQLYYQIYEIIKQNIKTGIYPVRSLIPSEENIATSFNVSRITVRKALDLLVMDGLIIRKRGVGTFVLPEKVEQELNKVIDFNDDMKKHGYDYSTKMIVNEIVPSTNKLSQALDLPNNALLIHIKRLRLMNNEPMCIESAYFSYDRFPKIYGIDFSSISLRDTLKKEYNVDWAYSYQKLLAIKANQDTEDLLQISKNDPILYVERVSYQNNNFPGEYIEIFYRSDSYYFVSKLTN